MNERDKLLAAVKEELFGPSDYASEETLGDSPSNRYFCGVLYPKTISAEQEERGGDPKNSKEDEPVEQEESKSVGIASLYDLSDEQESDLNSSNAFKQSAISMSIALKEGDSIKATARFALYEHVKNAFEYKRHPFEKNTDYIPLADLLEQTKDGSSYQFNAYDQDGIRLDLRIFRRWKQKDSIVFAVCLINDSDINGKTSVESKTFFQVELCIESKNGFAHFHERAKSDKNDLDKNNNLLLYRTIRSYAIGHGCSPLWDDRTGDAPKKVTSSFLPDYELKAVVPSGKASGLSMKLFSRDAEKENTLTVLEDFCNEYKKWILEREESELPSVPEHLKQFGVANISKCRECLARMRKGVSILKQDDVAFLAFKLMNRAMLLQQIHSKVPPEKQKLTISGENGKPCLQEETRFTFPDPDNFTKEEDKKYGHWRPFQLGFILLTIESVVNPDSADRSIVDLIWFPTGGGKTEAYLGLTAFTLLYNRLQGRDKGDCVQVFMRYTLRLLTSQQYQRAASLICALEYIRRESNDLGEKPFSIGLWVGMDSSPNTRQDAKDRLADLKRTASSGKEIKKNPFILTRCPWCGAEMGISHRHKRVFGYTTTPGVASKQKFVFACDNPECEFHSPTRNQINEYCLPLKVIDQDIYEEPPSVLIGTVDKFAMIPFRDDARSLFGLSAGATEERSRPQLVIQDELHLITGPLGSAVACYETMFDALCSYSTNGSVKPKIVASTATISQASSQCHCLFGIPEESVRVFPSPCLSANETYFSEAKDQEPGRKYVGVYSPASSSSSTSAIHFLAAVLSAKKTINWANGTYKDAYWTNVCYFNSIRELAQAVTWQNADVAEQEARINKRIDPTQFKIPSYVAMEMNSRNGDEDVSTYLAKLNTEYSETNNQALDLVYTTNMFSVGVDIDRLGLMTVFGQPKTASEYIQATSRVGRKTKERPGIVFTLYNPLRPRDKSIFEKFEIFHSKLYASVEPMSVTPFSPQMRKKAMPALIIGIANSLCDDSDLWNNPKRLSEEGWMNKAKEIILKRVSKIDPDEYENTKKQIEKILHIWIDVEAVTISSYPLGKRDLPSITNDPAPAIVPDGSVDNLPGNWKGISMGVPTSMRSVDQTCLLTLFNNILGDDEDE